MRIIEFTPPVLTDVFCPQVGWTVARDGFCYDWGSTAHHPHRRRRENGTEEG